MDRDELLGSYKAYRAITVAHHSAALRHVPMAALLDTAKRLGLGDGKVIFEPTEAEITLIMDLAIYGRKPGRTRAIDRFAQSAAAAQGSIERRVLEAMRRAQFAVVAVERRHDVAGLIISDLAREAQRWLIDVNLEMHAQPGLCLAGRFFAIDGYVMSCGAVIPAEPETLLDGFDASVDSSDPELVLEDPRFATAVFRDAIASGLLGGIVYTAPGQSSVTITGPVERDPPSPLHSRSAISA